VVWETSVSSDTASIYFLLFSCEALSFSFTCKNGSDQDPSLGTALIKVYIYNYVQTCDNSACCEISNFKLLFIFSEGQWHDSKHMHHSSNTYEVNKKFPYDTSICRRK
jgi:hypothetical protein